MNNQELDGLTHPINPVAVFMLTGRWPLEVEDGIVISPGAVFRTKEEV